MHGTSRRDVLRAMVLGGLGMALHIDSEAAANPTETKSLERLLAHLGDASIHVKAQIIQEIVERVGFGPTGIMYSMQKLEKNGIRPFRASDFQGKTSLDASVGKLKLDGPHDYLHGENSITQSGVYLASQAYRYKATKSPKALAQARRAFESLDLIYRMGEKDGKPGWMGKPYGFRPSVQTSGDQYLHASWGLFTYHGIAPAPHRKRIEEMVIGFADYWRNADYVLSYFGNSWDQKGETDSYNAIYAAINAVAYHFSRSPVHLGEFEKLMGRETWTKGTRIGGLRDSFHSKMKETGKAEVIPYSACFSLVKDLLKPGEFLCWETTIHSQFVVLAADVISQVMPDVLHDKMESISTMWWREWKYGIGSDFMPYYWFAVNLLTDTWRPLPSTKLLPKDKWLFGDPFSSYISQVRWMDPLARFMVVSAIAGKHAPGIAKEAKSVAQGMMASLDWKRLHWLFDPDGEQLIPEISYYGECLSSEVPASFLAAYWRGRCDGLWQEDSL
jgi:hypothetical protein